MNRRLHPLLPLLCAGVLGLSAVGAAVGDEVKLSGLWIPNVEITGIERGNIVYVTGGGREVARPVGQLGGVRLEKYPQLEAAQVAAEAGDRAGAIRAYTQVLSAAKEDWLKQWVRSRLVALYDAEGKGVEATQEYAALISSKADAALLAQPPLASVQGGEPAARQRAATIIADVAGNAPEGAKDYVQSLVDAAGPVAEVPATGTGGQSSTLNPMTGGTGTSTGQPPEVPAGPSAIPLPRTAGTGTVANLLRQGQFQQALDRVDQELQARGEEGQKFYFRGLAQQGLADAAQGEAAENLYKDAGLSFMRSVANDPRSSSATFALIEAAHVHLKIGRPDKAVELLQRIIDADSVDAEVEPVYAERLGELLTQARDAAR